MPKSKLTTGWVISHDLALTRTQQAAVATRGNGGKFGGKQ